MWTDYSCSYNPEYFFLEFIGMLKCFVLTSFLDYTKILFTYRM